MASQILRTIRELVTFAALLGGVAVPVWAQDGLGGNRAYLGGGLAYAVPNFSGFNDNTHEAESTFGFDLRAGHRWRYVAAEVDFQYHTRFDLTVDDPRNPGRRKSETLKAFTLAPNVKVYPLSGRFQPYVLLGLGLQHTRTGSGLDDGEAGVARFGGGFELYFVESLAVFFEGGYGLGIKSDYDIIPVIGGLQFHLH